MHDTPNADYTHALLSHHQTGITLSPDTIPEMLNLVSGAFQFFKKIIGLLIPYIYIYMYIYRL